MSPRKQLRLAIGAYLDEIERKIRESVQVEGKERAATETLAKPTPNSAVLREWARRYGSHPPESVWNATDDLFQPIEDAKINWDRWHELLDTRATRALTTSEQQEYEGYARIVAQLDAEEGGAADVALGNLVKEHERVIASIRRLTDAVRAAAEQPPTPSEQRERIEKQVKWKGEPIEVEMRLIPPPRSCDNWGWECHLADLWVLGSYRDTSRYFPRDYEAKASGEAWLAALSEQVGVKLVPKWEGEQPTKTNPDTPATFDFGDALAALRAGKRVRRLGWTNPIQWLELGEDVGGQFVGLKSHLGHNLISWLVRQETILATDWVVEDDLTTPSREEM